MLARLLLTILLLSLPGSVYALELTENFDSCSSPPCTCSGTTITGYSTSLSGCKFGDSGTPWTNSYQSTGGVNNTGYHKATQDQFVNGENDEDVHLDSNLSGDADYYVRLCVKLSSSPSYLEGDVTGCDCTSNCGNVLDHKITYDYLNGTSNPHHNLFWHPGSSTDHWLGGGNHEFAIYVNGIDSADDVVTQGLDSYGWLRAENQDTTHTNYLVLDDHIGEWICFVEHIQTSGTTHYFTAWVTTEWGASNCSSGTTCLNGSVREFNNYQYIYARVFNQTGSTIGALKLGSYTNECVPYNAWIGIDSIAISDSAINSNVFTATMDSTAYGHVTGVTQPTTATFVSAWSGNGTITGSGDDEVITVTGTQYMATTVLNTGVTTVTLSQNVYRSGDTGVLKYRTCATDSTCTGAWTTYSAPFDSLGYIQLRVEAP